MEPSIRLATEADAGAIREIYAPHVEESAVSFERSPPSDAEVARRVREKTERFPWLVCAVDGDLVGYAYASPYRERWAYQWGVEVSVYVAETSLRAGVGSGLYESLFSLLERQGFFSAYAVITLPNPGSVGFHEAFGFERVGHYPRAGYKNGAWHDVGHWERSIRPHEPDPSAPTPLPDLLAAGDHGDAVAAGESWIDL